MKINVIVVDDQDIMVQGLSMILSKDEAIEIVGTGTNGDDALKLCQEKAVDVVLMDINMPVMNGVEATEKIKAYNSEIKILVLTTFNEDDYIFGSLKNGASGYLLKDASPKEIIEGIKTVYDGGTLMNPGVATKVVKHLADVEKEFNNKVGNVDGGENDSINLNSGDVDQRVDSLTDREKDICHYLGEGCNNKEIGEALYISEGTVKNNITRILDKLDLRDRTQLALFSLKNKL